MCQCLRCLRPPGVGLFSHLSPPDRRGVPQLVLVSRTRDPDLSSLTLFPPSMRLMVSSWRDVNVEVLISHLRSPTCPARPQSRRNVDAGRVELRSILTRNEARIDAGS